MILFSLKCRQNHQFDAWFQNNTGYEKQVKAGIVSCPQCGETSVTKAPMAPNIHSGKRQKMTLSEQQAEMKSDQGNSGAGKQNAGMGVSAVSEKNETSEISQQFFDQAREVHHKLQRIIEQNFDNVGKDFVEEARRIHNGEADQRNIYGEASQAETEELQEEGIDIVKMPWLRKTDA